MPTHFLHVRKTGGTAMKHALHAISREFQILLYEHNVRLSQIPTGQPVVFVLRHPVPRYVSGFNSRFRKGQPHHYIEWRPEEARGFELFKTPNALAEALSSEDSSIKERAEDAMRSIRHVCNTYADWFDGIEEIEARLDDILLIGAQEHLADDFARLKRLLGLPEWVSLPTDSVRTHATPPGFDKKLSELGAANITRWYAKDIALYERCMELRTQLLERS